MGGMIVIRWTMTENSHDTLQKVAKKTGCSIEAGYHVRRGRRFSRSRN